MSSERSKPSPVGTDTDTTSSLRQLVAALDARVPHLERAGETDIAREAARLRGEALVRIAEIERAGAGE
jgi:hypothetical protein